jgi:hypothetical protein
VLIFLSPTAFVSFTFRVLSLGFGVFSDSLLVDFYLGSVSTINFLHFELETNRNGFLWRCKEAELKAKLFTMFLLLDIKQEEELNKKNQLF